MTYKMTRKYDIKKAAKKLSIPEKSLKSHIDTFINKFEEDYEDLLGIVKDDDYDKIYFQFHKLKSTFKMISAHAAVEICSEACDGSINNEQLPYNEYLNRLAVCRVDKPS